MAKRNRTQDLRSWRRTAVIDQTSKGRTQREIATLLKVGIATVNRDLQWFREKAKKDNSNFIEKIQEEHEKSMIGLNAVLKEAWLIVEDSSDGKEKLSALALVKDCYSLREELICNLPIIDQALKLDSEGKEEKIQVGKLVQRTEDKKRKTEKASESQGRKVTEAEGEREERIYEIQESGNKAREDQKRETTNRTF